LNTDILIYLIQEVEKMKKAMSLFTIIFIVAIGIILLHAHITLAQGPADSFFDVFFEAIEDATEDQSVDPEEVLTPEQAVEFEETVLMEEAEGLPDDMQRIDSDEVTRILRGMPELFNALGEVELELPDPIGLINVNLTPGAAVIKWDPEGRWCSGPHIFNIYTVAKVNQWIRASMKKTRIAWKVFKPGRYVTDCMYMNVHSNAQVNVSLKNQGPLANPAGLTIPTWYAISKYIQTLQDEVFYNNPPSGFDPIIDWVPDGEEGTNNLPSHAYVKLWNMIYVNKDVPPGLYTTANASAVITIIGTL
jgi:hypothetical protein